MAASLNDQLRRFVPLDGLSSESLEKLTAQTRLQTLAAGKLLFRQGDLDESALYLLRGDVRLSSADGSSRTVRAGSPESLHPLANRKPRPVTVVCASEVTVARVDTELLDILLTWEQSAGYVVEEIHPGAEPREGADWMTRMLSSNVFYQVPPANIQAILTRMEPMRVKAGTIVLEQDEEGDYYYVVKSGRAEVVRRGADGRETRLAERGVGDGFGEEALMSSGRRNASVRMLGDGELMRLARSDFEALLKAPLLRELSLGEACERVEAEQAAWVDVRLESEYANEHLDGAINLPLYLLRVQSARLPDDRPLVVYCDTGRRSSAAAYLLSERGFEVYVLRGGFAGSSASRVA